MPLSDLLEWLRNTLRSGLLTVRRDGRQWDLLMQNGLVSGFYGPEVAEDLSEAVVRFGFMDEAGVRDAMRSARAVQKPLFALLSERLKNNDKFGPAIEELVREAIYDLFLNMPGE